MCLQIPCAYCVMSLANAFCYATFIKFDFHLLRSPISGCP